VIGAGFASARAEAHVDDAAAQSAAPVDPAPADAIEPQEQAPERVTLLREGSQLIAVKGRMHRDSATGWWRFKIDQRDSATPNCELTILPSSLLGEMQQIVKSSPRQQVVFEATGRIFVYQGRNYFLPTHVPRLLSHDAEEAGAHSDGPASPTPGAQTAPPASTAESAGQDSKPRKPEESPEDIIKRLEQDAGGMVKSTTTAPGSTAPAANAPTAGLENDPAARSGAPAGSRSSKLLRENTSISFRRGTVARDANGSWQFVFDADAAGQADPPVTLLPCLLLERIEAYTRKEGSAAPMILSGEVFVYNGQNYLLPTVFRIPQERTRIVP
jgi:hypothetical protein